MKASVIAFNALRRLSRDRTSLFFTIVLPIAIIVIIGLATSGFDDDTLPVGLIAPDGGSFSAEVVAALDDAPGLDMKRYDDRDVLNSDVRRGAVGAGVVIPDDLDAAMPGGEQVAVVVVSDPTSGQGGALRSVVGAAVAGVGGRVLAARFGAEYGSGSFETNLAEAAEVTELVRPIGVEVTTLGAAGSDDVDIGGFAYTTAANLVLFVFITSLAGASILIESRRTRVTHRMYSTPTSAATIVAGEVGGRFLIALAQALFIVVVGAVVFGVDWGDPAGAAVLVLLFVLVGTAVGVLFGTVLSTPQQAGALGPMVGIGIGMLSGCMWPREIMPVFMQRIGQLFPHSWAMDGWIDLIGRGETLSGILPQVAVLSAFVAVLLPLATWRLRRAITA